MPASLKELSTKRNDLFKANKALLAKADEEKRNLNSEEQSEYDARDAEIETLGSQVNEITANETRRQRINSLEEELSRPLPRITSGRGDPKPSALGGDGATMTLDFGRAGKVQLSPDDPLYSRATPEYSQMFRGILLGEKRNWDQLGAQVSSDPKGGYLTSMSFLANVIKFLDDECPIRQLATVLPPTNAKSVGALSFDTDYADADWTAEVTASDLSEDDAARWGNREMIPHMLTKLIKCSKKLVRAASMGPNIETFIAQRAAYRFAITENKAFLTGNGSKRPLGLFTASNDGIPTSRDTACTSTSAFTMDELWDLKFSLKFPYQRKASWIVSRTFMKNVRKLKYGTGEYMLGLNGSPDMLLDMPVYVDENAPATFTTGQYIALLGDLSFYYIQDTPNWEVETLAELFTLKNQVGWLFRKETDAMPVLSEAFARLKLG